MRKPMAMMIAKAYCCYVERAVTKQMQCIRVRGDAGGAENVYFILTISAKRRV